RTHHRTAAVALPPAPPPRVSPRQSVRTVGCDAPTPERTKGGGPPRLMPHTLRRADDRGRCGATGISPQADVCASGALTPARSAGRWAGGTAGRAAPTPPGTPRAPGTPG